MRDVSGLAEWVCDAAEGSLLASEAGQARLRAFHLLWTLKEAMLKALDLPFPAGMRRVGLAVNGDGGMKLRAPSGQWRAQAWELPDQWIAAAAWSASAEERRENYRPAGSIRWGRVSGVLGVSLAPQPGRTRIPVCPCPTHVGDQLRT